MGQSDAETDVDGGAESSQGVNRATVRELGDSEQRRCPGNVTRGPNQKGRYGSAIEEQGVSQLKFRAVSL